ncbi:MAG: DUF5131 family protein [Clostridia bacterium]|nr:DUF5131 family protein [Clostridia bacterium]
MGVVWNPWHGCSKISAGCQNCYVYRRDESIGKDAQIVTKTLSFDLPVRRARNGGYKIATGETVFTCFTSDFLIDKADEWRLDAWQYIKERNDLGFFFITKRIDRFRACIPDDWEGGYNNVTVGCTVENQQMADYRLPIFLSAPIMHKIIICEPILSQINLEQYLNHDIEQVIVGGESGNNARICDYAWVTDIRRQCEVKGVSFGFKQTGARFLKDGRVYRIPRKFQHTQAKKAGIDLHL